jgi:hypothetical protein
VSPVCVHQATRYNARMPRRFQFSLRRLLASLSAFCVAGAALANGMAALRAADVVPFAIALFVGWSMFGLGIWLVGTKLRLRTRE